MTNNIDELYTCTFCGKNKYQVDHIMTSKNGNICNECISIAHRRYMELEEEKQATRILDKMRRICFYEFWGAD